MEIIQVRRANVILDVPEDQQAEYLAKGFDVIGADGKVVTKATPNDPNALKKAYSDLLKENQELKAENDKLKKQLTSEPVKAEEPKKDKVDLPAANEVSEDDFEEPNEEEDFVPINKRSSKKNKK